MKIGIDIDNVISNMDEELLKEYLNHDKELRNTGIINENARYIRHGMFDWTGVEEEEFYYSNIERIAQNFKPIKDSKETIDKLKEDGHEIYIITGRDNGEYTNPHKMTEDWLKKYDIYYDKLIFTNAYKKSQKSIECIKNNIDIMIEDSIATCVNLKENNINVLTMNTKYNIQDTNNELKRVSTWKEIYEFISNMYKINVILDTDTYNECDDQFALSYLIKSKDKFNIEAITIAPYSHNKENIKVTVPEGQENSYNEALKICNWLNFDTSNKVYKGSMDYIQNGYDEENEAVNKIIEISLKNEKTYILAIGAITNVALAIKKEPKIMDRIEVIWLGGNQLGYKDNLEYNFKQDIKAVRIIFESQVKLTILPCRDVVSKLRIDINTLKENIGNKSELCDYLINRFYNDGYHGVQETRVIWDISLIAYMINKEWFEIEQISCPRIKEDTSYELTKSNHKIKIVNNIDTNKVYEDLFNKLGEIV